MKKKILNKIIVLSCICFVMMLITGCKYIFHTHEYRSYEKGPTCSQEGYTQFYCTCGDSYRDFYIDKLPHTPITVEGFESTCSNTGLSDGVECSVCYKVLKKQEVTPKKEHKIVIDSKVEPTCTTTGLTEGSHCANCFEVIIPQEQINVSEHISTNYNGICDICNTKFEEVIDISSINQLQSIDMTKNYRLICDININYNNWIPLGTKENPFIGKFYGNGFKISNLNFSNRTVCGLFGYNQGVIENVVVENYKCTVDNFNTTAGVIVAVNGGTVKNCSIQGSIVFNVTNYYYDERSWPSYDGGKISYSSILGGIVATNKGNILDCTVNSTIQSTITNTSIYKIKASLGYLEAGYDSQSILIIYFGGIAGRNEVSITNCHVNSIISGNVIVDANNNGRGTAKATTTFVAGSLVGENTGNIFECSGVQMKILEQVTETKLSNSNLNTYGIVCKLNLSFGNQYYGLIGTGEEKVFKVTYKYI